MPDTNSPSHDESNLGGNAQVSGWDEYAEHRTGSQIDRLLHYGHIIPISRGLTRDHVDENFPGWTWSELADVMKAAGVFIWRGGGPCACKPTVKAVHFTDVNHWAVEWLSGEVTRSDPEGF